MLMACVAKLAMGLIFFYIDLAKVTQVMQAA
jgi:hypothetical protein